eukprot:COSAG06_NODE_17956_length_912_cov_1.076261_2_plen_109_part_00
MMGNVTAMGAFDWVALVFATFMVALAVNQELKDVELVSIATRQAGDKLSRGWRIALALLNSARRWVFLPSLLMAVPTLVLFKGGEYSRSGERDGERERERERALGTGD